MSSFEALESLQYDLEKTAAELKEAKRLLELLIQLCEDNHLSYRGFCAKAKEFLAKKGE